MTKRALVISGGGSRGSFAVGALGHLMEKAGLDFHLFVGTSTGALIVPPLAARGKAGLAQLREEYTTVHTRDIVRERLSNPLKLSLISWYYTDPLAERIRNGVGEGDFRTIDGSARPVFLTTVNLQTGRLVYFQAGQAQPPVTIDDGDVVRVTSLQQLHRAMLASSSIPVLMPPVRVPGPQPDDPFVDGGVREYAPIKIAIEAGADEIICIVLAPPPKQAPPRPMKLDTVIPILKRTVDLLSNEVGENDIRLSKLFTDILLYRAEVGARIKEKCGLSDAEVAALLDVPRFRRVFRNAEGEERRAVRLCVIRPEAPLQGDTLRFDPKEMTANLAYGEKCAAAQYPQCFE
ncbi:MAG TPA: patatin-like phospholipase family protein [Longimicrobium sp.]|jgi:predicted acylesterase/phospholipase RssA